MSKLDLENDFDDNFSDEEVALNYDEEAAVKYIQNYLPQELKERFSEDDIYYILDVVCDFYEENGFFSDEYDSEKYDPEKEEEDLIRYVVQQARKDGIGEFSSDEIRLVLKAEEAYCDILYGND
jgi:hypothetical protein